jgi:hypothetical protein
MGLKGYRLWDMGQLDSNVQSPTLGDSKAALWRLTKSSGPLAQCVAVQVSLKATFETSFLI